MNKQFEAYYSPGWRWLWSTLTIFFTMGIVLFSILWLGVISICFIIISSVCIFAFLFMYTKTKKETGIAVEIIDDILILHKKETISIPLKEIKKINIHDGHGSFDITVKTVDKKVSLHCFIHNDMQKKKMLIDFLKSKKINVFTYDLSSMG